VSQTSFGRATWEVAIAFVLSVMLAWSGYTSKWMWGQRPV
jgi:hypothetical protein